MTRTALVIALLTWTLVTTGCQMPLGSKGAPSTAHDVFDNGRLFGGTPGSVSGGFLVGELFPGDDSSGVSLPEMPEPGKPAIALLTAVDARKIVYNGRFGVVVNDVPKAIAEFRQSAEQAGGFMARTTLDEITVRVPAAKFNETVEKVRAMGVVSAQDISAVDVTEQYADLELRLAAARTAMKRYAELLEKSEKVEDTLAVERELQRVRVDVEQLEGQLRNLASQVTYATVVVKFARTQESPATQMKLPFSWLGRLGLDELLATGR